MQLDVLESLRIKVNDVLSQRSCDDVVDDAIEICLTLAQEVIRVRMKRCVREDLAMGYMWELVMDFRS